MKVAGPMSGVTVPLLDSSAVRGCVSASVTSFISGLPLTGSLPSRYAYISASVLPHTGCGVKQMRSCGMPRWAALESARFLKAMVTMGAVGKPICSNFMQ